MSQASKHRFSVISVFALCLLGLLCALPTQTVAQDKTWTGNTNNNWHNPNNWNPSGVPGPNDDVLVYNQGSAPVISNNNATVANLQIADFRAGTVTVSSGQTLTLTNGLSMDGGGSTLGIESGGNVDLTGGSFTMSFNNSQINMTSGSFTSDVDMTIRGNGFSAGSGTVMINGQLTVPTSKTFNVNSGTVTVTNNTEINGTYNGDNGLTTFHGNVKVRSGGVIDIGEDETGTIIFNGSAEIRDNGTLNMGSGTVNLNAGLTAESGGYINVEDGNLNVQGDAAFQNNGNLSVDDGNVNVSGDASLQNGGSFDFNEGSLNVGGNSTFQNGGTFNAGKSQIDLKGDLTVQNGGDFNADSSTVSFSGGQTQQINTNGNGITFHNVKVDSGSTVQTEDSNVTVNIENDLTVEENSNVDVQGNDSIDVQGNLNNQGNVQSQKPFVYAITTPSLSEVLVAYDKKMDPVTSQNTSNYSINKGISVSNATLNPSDSTVTLQVSPQLAENAEYELTVNNVLSDPGQEQISNNHIKRFTTLVDITYYSRATGAWDNPNSWSTESHTGSAASNIPNAETDEDAIIANNHTITVGSSQNITNLAQLTVDDTGTLTVSASGTLILDDFIITGGGSFELQSGGTINMGSAEGIAAAGTNAGNIQTESRTFSNSANYIYSGSSAQKTGSGLPQTVNDLRINNTNDVRSSDNLQVDGTLYLQNGSLTIPSGQGLIANSKTIQNGDLIFQRILSGSPGWRMLSSPVTVTYDDFLDGILTQGYDGAQYDASTAPYDTLQPSVLYYDETYEGTDNQRWLAPSSASATVPTGTGYNVYLFGDITSDDRYNNPLPDTLTVQGQEHSGAGNQINLGITYTAEADSGWNLVGNPYGAAIDWDAGGWTKTNIDQTIYIWDPDENSYKTWNGSTGSLGNGLIPPFQAFWVKANAENPQLSVNESAKTFGGNFVGKELTKTIPEIEVQLNYEGNTSSIYFSFYENSKVGKDKRDGYYLQPPPNQGTYSEIFSIGRNQNRFTINALPKSFGVPIEIPISTNTIENFQKVSESVRLNIAQMQNLPPSWKISLVDRKTGQTLTPTAGMNYGFKTAADLHQQHKDNSNVLQKDYHILSKSDPSESRFALRIDPGYAGSELPDNIELKQNYPNPFNPRTTIRFTLPIQNNVTLEVYNILGRKVTTLVDDESFQAGQHSISWDGSNAASGTYIYRLTTSDRIISKKMTLIK